MLIISNINRINGEKVKLLAIKPEPIREAELIQACEYATEVSLLHQIIKAMKQTNMNACGIPRPHIIDDLYPDDILDHILHLM